MPVDLKWRDAFSASGAFANEVLDTGWPPEMTPMQLAKLQRPVSDPNGGASLIYPFTPFNEGYVLYDSDGVTKLLDTTPTEIRVHFSPDRSAQDALRDALHAACINGKLDCSVVTCKRIDPTLPTGIILCGDGTAKAGRLNVIRETTPYVGALQFAKWLYAQGEPPSVHIAAWFEALGVAWPPVAGAESEAPTDWAGLVESFKTRRPRTPWTDDERAILQAEFNRRSGWRRADDGVTWVRNSSIQTAMAGELGFSRQALDRHLGDGPDHGASAFSDMSKVITGTR